MLDATAADITADMGQQGKTHPTPKPAPRRKPHWGKAALGRRQANSETKTKLKATIGRRHQGIGGRAAIGYHQALSKVILGLLLRHEARTPHVTAADRHQAVLAVAASAVLAPHLSSSSQGRRQMPSQYFTNAKDQRLL